MHELRPTAGSAAASREVPQDAPTRAEEPELSVVVPVYDEKDNIGELYREVRDALDGHAFELIFVDDGSRDGSDAVIRRLESGDPRVRGVYFARNRGQTAAMLAGMLRARGALVVTMDGDGQNDPADVPRLLDALGDNDAVVGMRAKRRDTLVRRISSRLANRVRNALTGDTITDTGCSLKLFRRETLEHLPRFEGLHRFLPTLLRYSGFRVVELPVHHRPRSRGASKYGIWNRAPRAALDLLAVCWMRRRWVDLSAETRDVERMPGGAESQESDSAQPETERDSVPAR